MNNYLAVLKKYNVFTGRSTRTEFWMFELVSFLVTIAILILRFIGTFLLPQLTYLFVGIYILYILAVILPSIAVEIRRLHDTNHSGWWLLIAIIPLIGAIVLLVFLATDSDADDNKYGSNPKMPAPAPVQMQA